MLKSDSLTSSEPWRPSASLQALQQRAELYRYLRQFFHQQQVMEVETPVLSLAAVSDANIEPMKLAEEPRYLQTSPEYPMKRLLAAGSPCIYQICKVFRAGEAGRRHNPEFTMLEWYRLGINHQQLMQQVDQLLTPLLKPQQPALYLSYQQALLQYADIDIDDCDDQQIAQLGREIAGADLALSRDGWLDIIMSHKVEPALPTQQLVFIYDYPASQAVLAKIDKQNNKAQRFELYFNGVELANGYHELTDAEEQRQRFISEASNRPLDEHLLTAMQHGLPECAGVALGLDRLLMQLLNADQISQVICFDWFRA